MYIYIYIYIYIYNDITIKKTDYMQKTHLMT